MISPTDVHASLRRLPPPVFEDVCRSSDDDLNIDDICEPEALVDIGRRLVLAAGLVACAKYCSDLRLDQSRRQLRLDQSIIALLQKGYTLGIASTIISGIAAAANTHVEPSP